MKRVIAAALLVAAGLPAALAEPPHFEAATLKQAPPPTGNYPITLGLVQGSRFYMTNVTLSDCLKFAYGLVSDDQISGPDWLWSRSDLYDIEAAIPPNPSHELVMQMLQTLLTERMGVVIHHEDKTMKYLALVRGKGELKMAPADTTEERNNSGGTGRLTGNRASMGLVTMLLSRLEHQIVVDQTGLTGEYQIRLHWAPGSGVANADSAPPDSTAPSLFAAVQEQLGLKLESRHGLLDSIVVDRAEKIPAEN
ncbi:MAG TPA: TIGR03435 family protein [Bryobacteraceae bacterium]|nr:TIGR03435 family protein [Bryobacteraceae bacterium]